MSDSQRLTRTLVLVWRHWSLVVAGLVEVPSVTLRSGRVVACSPSARVAGVRIGQRRREAQERCPELSVVVEDRLSDARAFAKVAAVVAEFTPGVEVTRPGMCAIPVRGPARYFGGEEALAERMIAAVEAAVGQGAILGGDKASLANPSLANPSLASVGQCRIGIADGARAAELAAGVGIRIEPGGTAAFLGPMPVGVLRLPELSDLLVRLGIPTLAAFARLPETAVQARFGRVGAAAQLFARGLADRPLLLGDPVLDLAVEEEFCPPIGRVDAVGFAASNPAEELCARLSRYGRDATCVSITFTSEDGEVLTRLWRAERPFTVRSLLERVRWQLEGWLAPRAVGSDRGEGEIEVVRVRLAVEESFSHRDRQLDLFGGEGEADSRAARGLARVQGILGHEEVLMATLRGGRGPHDQVRLSAWGSPVGEIGQDRPAQSSRSGDAGGDRRGQGPPTRSRRRVSSRVPGACETPPPFPGRLPVPAPSLVYLVPLLVEVRDRKGRAVTVSGRGEVSASPALLCPIDSQVMRLFRGPISSKRAVLVSRGVSPEGTELKSAEVKGIGLEIGIVAWSRVWPADERWWDQAEHRRRVRIQVLLADESAHLLVLEHGRWGIEASYD